MPKLVFELFSFSGQMKVLHLSWFAFFTCFIVWFNHAPLMLSIQESIGLTESEVNIILLLNFALTIPARLLIGYIVDLYGSKVCFSILLAISSIPCFMFALAESFHELAWARFILSFIGAGFVIGIRIISDWFPAHKVGFAEGIYGGWGNFGLAAVTVILPWLAVLFDEHNGWRYAIAVTGAVALLYSFIYYYFIENHPPNAPFRIKNNFTALEVTSVKDLFLYLATTLPLYLSMSLLSWILSTPETQLLSGFWLVIINLLIWGVFFIHAYKIVDINASRLSKPIPNIHLYSFKQISILSVAYLMTFGSKLAVVSMLPMFFFETFHNSQNISKVEASLLAASFIVMNLVARPAGGWLSDQFGRKKCLLIFVAGMSLGYLFMSFISQSWPILLTLLVTVICSIFLQAAEGAVFAVVPLIKRPMTGQFAGIVGAYGNAGAVIFLAILTFVPSTTFFTILAGISLISLLIINMLEEPKETITEIMPDGSSVRLELK